MSAPLRRVVSSKHEKTGASMSKRGDTVSIRYEYAVVYALECGHHFRVRYSEWRATGSKRCKKCLTQVVKP